MIWRLIKTKAYAFAVDTRGTIMVEAVVTLPMLILGLSLMFEFFEIHRFQSTRDKATYTIADMISRENDVITETYMDNVMNLFDEIADDYGDNQIRVSIITFDADDDEYAVSWSRIRGTGNMSVLQTDDVRDWHSTLPTMGDREELILVESTSGYRSIFDVGLKESTVITTRVFTSIRFAPQICFVECQPVS